MKPSSRYGRSLDLSRPPPPTSRTSNACAPTPQDYSDEATSASPFLQDPTSLFRATRSFRARRRIRGVVSPRRFTVPVGSSCGSQTQTIHYSPPEPQHFPPTQWGVTNLQLISGELRPNPSVPCTFSHHLSASDHEL